MNALDLRTVAHALGGEVSGRQVLAPAPGHSRQDRSLSVRLSPQSPTGFIVHTFSGHDFREARDYVAAKLGMGGDAWRTRGSGETRPAPVYAVPEPGPEPNRKRRIARAAVLWREGIPAQRTLVERYLASRGLELPAGDTALRYHPRCPWRDEARDETIFVPAMLAAMRAVDGDALTAVHRTRLSPEGAKVDRRMLGIGRDAAIKLDADEVVTMGLAIGEGVEMVLQARQLGFIPGWALGSAGAIADFPVLPGIEALTILSENDDTNRRAVERCARRWHAAAREVTIIEPASGSDLNDAARRVA